MPRGIDIYRYQTVTDPAAVAASSAGAFAWVKATDGFGPAIVRADRQARQMSSAGIPTGLYHYAQLGDPVAQANVLAGELGRLLDAGIPVTGLPPVLDLEDPHTPGTDAANFARAFLRHLARRTGPRVALYANTSMLTGIRADDIRRDLAAEGIRVVIWAARYGANDGRNNGLGGYRGHVDVHQFTSNGVVPGISGRVDLNDAANMAWAAGPEPEEDMPDVREIWEDYRVQVLDANGNPVTGYQVSPQEMLAQTNRVAWLLLGKVNNLSNDEANILAAIGALSGASTGNVDTSALATALAATLGPNLGRQVADELHARLQD